SLSGAEECDYPTHLPAVGPVDPAPTPHHGRREAGHGSYEEVALDRSSAQTATRSDPRVAVGIHEGGTHGHEDPSYCARTDRSWGRGRGRGQTGVHRDRIRPEAPAVAAIAAIGPRDSHRARGRSRGGHEARAGRESTQSARA